MKSSPVNVAGVGGWPGPDQARENGGGGVLGVHEQRIISGVHVAHAANERINVDRNERTTVIKTS